MSGSAQADRDRAAGGAVPRRLPRQHRCFPLVVSVIVISELNPDIWLSPLMVLGTQWYILFNVIAGATTMPRNCATRAKFPGAGWLWWKRRPARRISLLCHRRHHRLGRLLERQHRGGGRELGQRQARRAWPGRLYRGGHRQAISAMVLGAAVMSSFVVVLNRTVWRPLYDRAETRFRMS